jgi:hypothetical protein
MGLVSSGLDIGIFCGFLYCVFLVNMILGLVFLGLALPRPQVQPLASRSSVGSTRARPRAPASEPGCVSVRKPHAIAFS